MAIIIEGADLAGKTTLVKQLVVRFRAGSKHLGRPKPGTRHWNDVCEALLNDPPHTVYDRMCIGSMVYGQLLKDEHNQNPVTNLELASWAAAIKASGSMVIYAYCSDTKVIEERFARDGDEYLPLDTILEAHKLYPNYMGYLKKIAPGLRFAMYDSATQRAGEFIKEHAHILSAALIGERLSKPMLNRYLAGVS